MRGAADTSGKALPRACVPVPRTSVYSWALTPSHSPALSWRGCHKASLPTEREGHAFCIPSTLAHSEGRTRGRPGHTWGHVWQSQAASHTWKDKLRDEVTPGPHLAAWEGVVSVSSSPDLSASRPHFTGGQREAQVGEEPDCSFLVEPQASRTAGPVPVITRAPALS